jgi:hypothetical protein
MLKRHAWFIFSCGAKPPRLEREAIEVAMERFVPTGKEPSTLSYTTKTSQGERRRLLKWL